MQYIIGSTTSGFLVMQDRVDATLHGGVRRRRIFFLQCHRVQHDEEDGSRYRAVALAHKAHGGHNGDGYE